jgi:hypothetical protein
LIETALIGYEELGYVVVKQIEGESYL